VDSSRRSSGDQDAEVREDAMAAAGLWTCGAALVPTAGKWNVHCFVVVRKSKRKGLGLPLPRDPWTMEHSQMGLDCVCEQNLSRPTKIMIHASTFLAL
jgi:hypothetical protein